MRLGLLDELSCPFTGADLELEVGDHSGDELLYGVLRGDGTRYPVVGGIPVLLADRDEVVQLVEAGQHDRALAAAVAAEMAMSRSERAVGAFDGSGLVGSLARRATGTARQRRAAAAARSLSRSSDPLTPLRLLYLDSAGRCPDAFDYFTHRISTPRHLVALACLEALPPGTGRLLDLGCGAGHLTWAAERLARRVVGVDRLLSLLLVARSLAGPAADLVCCDIGALPFGDDVFDAALASDVFDSVTAKASVVREVDRVLRPGAWRAFSSMKNAMQPRPGVYAGEPLSPRGWERLAGRLPHRLLPNEVILASYLRRQGLPAAEQLPRAEVEASAVITAVACGDEGALVDHGRIADWPHGRGTPVLNPLYVPAAGSAGTAGADGTRVFERRFPSALFRLDNPGIEHYLPEAVTLPAETARALESGTARDGAADLDALLAACVVIGVPPVLAPSRNARRGDRVAGHQG